MGGDADLIRGLPVALVVRLPRLHERPALVSQRIPVIRGPALPEGLALVEWWGGAVSYTRDVEGLEEEEQQRRRYFLQLHACAGGTAEPDESAFVRHSSALHTESAAVNAPPAGGPRQALAVRDVSRVQLKRLRTWAGEQAVRRGPRAEGGSGEARAVATAAHEQHPWDAGPRAGGQGAAPALHVEVARGASPHDARFVPIQRALAGASDGSSAASQLRQSCARAAAAHMSAMLLSKLVAAAELRVLRPLYAADSEARDHFHRLLTWLERFARPCADGATIQALGPPASTWSEVDELEALQRNPDRLRAALLDPGSLPHTRDTAVPDAAARTQTPPRLNALGNALADVLAVAIHMKRLPTVEELLRGGKRVSDPLGRS